MRCGASMPMSTNVPPRAGCPPSELSHTAITGGVLQGLVQVVVTRWIGGVFIEYFRNEMNEKATDWASLARAQWSKVTQPDELARLVKTGLARLGGKAI